MGVNLKNLVFVVARSWGVPFCLLVALGVFVTVGRIFGPREDARVYLGIFLFLVVTWVATLLQNPLWRYTLPAMWALFAVAATTVSSVLTNRFVRVAFVTHLVLFAVTKCVLHILEYVPTVGG